jgi:hypothetical protein
MTLANGKCARVDQLDPQQQHLSPNTNPHYCWNVMLQPSWLKRFDNDKVNDCTKLCATV